MSFGMFPSWVCGEILRAPQQLSEAGGRRPRSVANTASKAKRAKWATATALARASDSDNE